MKKYNLTINRKNYNVEVINFDGKKASVSVNGKPYGVDVAFESNEAVVAVPKSTVPKSVVHSAPVSKPAEVSVSGFCVRAPMPGLILKILVKTGDSVSAGQKVMSMEAMKMENDLNTSVAGTIKDMKVKEGDNVREGDVLIVIG